MADLRYGEMYRKMYRLCYPSTSRQVVKHVYTKNNLTTLFPRGDSLDEAIQRLKNLRLSNEALFEEVVDYMEPILDFEHDPTRLANGIYEYLGYSRVLSLQELTKATIIDKLLSKRVNTLPRRLRGYVLSSSRTGFARSRSKSPSPKRKKRE
jgi:hypothetical protein